MLSVVREAVRNQFEAAFCTLNSCIDLCPDEAWDGPVVNLTFCQVTFHTLFFADLYLAGSGDLDSLQQQSFHRENPDYFRDYEEFRDRKQTLLYDRPATTRYLAMCRQKARDVVAGESEETLTGPSGFEWRKCSRVELHFYNARHIFHHCAQLSLRLRQLAGIEVPWHSHEWSAK